MTKMALRALLGEHLTEDLKAKNLVVESSDFIFK